MPEAVPRTLPLVTHDDQTEVGSYFISNYPPFSQWQEAELVAVDEFERIGIWRDAIATRTADCGQHAGSCCVSGSTRILRRLREESALPSRGSDERCSGPPDPSTIYATLPIGAIEVVGERIEEAVEMAALKLMVDLRAGTGRPAPETTSPADRAEFEAGSRALLAWLRDSYVEELPADLRMCCSQPMEPEGHVCPRSNGHHPATV